MTTRTWNTVFCGFAAASFLALAAAAPAQAHVISLDVTGSGVSASLTVTYGATTDANYSNGFEITGLSGTFSDSNNGLNIVNATVVSLVPITHDTPEVNNTLAPDDFSRFAVAAGLDPQSNGFITYDNLIWPAGSPQTASDYPFHGGVLDIYGMLFTLSTGQTIDLWSNGILPGTSNLDYGVAVVTSDEALDYVGGASVSATPAPEPATLMLFGTGLFGFATARLRKNRGQSSRR